MAEFHRIGEPVRIPVGPATNALADLVKVDLSAIGPGITHFRAAVDCKTPVRLKGLMSGGGVGGRPTDTAQLVTATTGWLWFPGMVEILRTLLTPEIPIRWMSAMSIPSTLYGNATSGVIELQYGTEVG